MLADLSITLRAVRTYRIPTTMGGSRIFLRGGGGGGGGGGEGRGVNNHGLGIDIIRKELETGRFHTN